MKNDLKDYEVPYDINGKLYYPNVSITQDESQNQILNEDKLGLERITVKIKIKEENNSGEKLVTEVYGYRIKEIEVK